MALAETTIEDLRQTQHKDVDGTVICKFREFVSDNLI